MKKTHLIEPSVREIDDAYRRLGSGGFVMAKIKAPELGNILSCFEKTGFVAIEIIDYHQGDHYLTIQGLKGKHGPCFDTGRQVKYTGSAIAALDDDNHLLLAGKYNPVCEKTANIFQFSSYKNLAVITEGIAELIEKYKTDPELFSQDTFEDNQVTLFDQLKDRKQEEDRKNVFYTGPFKLLILSDGTMVRRGDLSSIPSADFQQLKKKDRLLEVRTDTFIQPSFFQKEYAQKGLKCLIDNLIIKKETESEPVNFSDMNALSHLNEKLAVRLTNLIRYKRKYFILTGSDPSEERGCCPSDEVGEANKLVKAGILASVSQETADDTCPITIFAFKNEIKSSDGDLDFRIDQDFRDSVLKQIMRKRSSVFQAVVKWGLVGFLVLSTVLAGIKFRNSILPGNSERHPSLYERFAPLPENSTLILLFHNQVRCTMCLNMERYIHKLLDEDYVDYQKKGLIKLILVNMNSKENQDLVERFELYTASVVLVRFKNGEENNVVVLRDIWKLHSDQARFMEEVNKELKTLISD